MKVGGHGQGAIISDSDYAKIRKQVSSKYRLLLDLARYTGERWGALVQLRVDDVFDSTLKPRSHILFRARTRKASPDGKRHTRTCPVHPELKELLERYSPPQEGYLFPGRSRQHITLRAADYVFRGAVETAGLSHKGYCTHSTRRTFVTRLYERGVDLHAIQQLTGHHDIKSLLRYVESDPDRLAKALSSL